MTTYGATSGGCGCGGGAGVSTGMQAASGTGGCGCGCGCEGGCEACGSDAFVRPRFFAGQLLTEEDLDLLSEYTTAKNRLHNRHFFGEGVVCGLEVACQPCGGGHVVVRPGYALDCCGNDIVVPCEGELDINAMVHRLRVETLGGYDCGDPCAEPAAKPAETSGTSDTGDLKTIDRGTAAEVDVHPPIRRYSLYVRYCEESTDPVAPYATDEPCGAQGCEPTRIREGFRYELRCEAKRKRPDDFVTRLISCLMDVRDLDRLAGRTRMWQQLAGPIPTALRLYTGQARRDFGEQDAQAMKTSFARLQSLREQPPEKATAEEVRSSLDDVRNVVMASATLHTLDQQVREEAIRKFDLADVVKEAPETARVVAEQLQPELHKIDDPFEQRAAHALLGEGLTWADPNLSTEERSDVRNAMAMSGIALDANVLRYYTSSLADLRDWLLARLDKSTFLTDCNLRKDVEAIVITAPNKWEDPVPINRIESTTSAGSALASALVRYVYGCICAALLPPCRPCEDTAVLLATVEVVDCDVVHICNLERTIPLTGTALAYWLPVQELARLLDLVCCVLPRRIGYLGWQRRPLPQPGIHEIAQPITATTDVPVAPPPPTLFGRTSVTPLRAEPVTNLLEVAGVPSTLTARVSRAVENVVALDPVRELAAPMFDRARRAVSAPDLGTVLATDAGREALATAVREVAPQIVADPAREAAAGVAATAATEAVERAKEAAAGVASTAASEAVERVAVRRLAKLEDRLKDVTALKRDVTTLRKRSDDLIKKNADLERRLAEIGGGG